MRHMLTYTEPLGRLVRAPLRWIPPETVLRVLSGPNRGLRWKKGAFTNSCWLGTYERPFAERFAAAISPGMVVYDIGANTGYYTIMAARLVGECGHVYAFEPIWRNCARITDHVYLNHFERRVTPMRIAIGDECCDSVSFAPGNTDAEWHLGADPLAGKTHFAVTAAMETIDHLVESGHIRPPTIIKVDIEGAESRAFAGAERTLRQHHPRLFMGDGVTPQTIAMLRAFGYTEIVESHGDVYAH